MTQVMEQMVGKLEELGALLRLVGLVTGDVELGATERAACLTLYPGDAQRSW